MSTCYHTVFFGYPVGSAVVLYQRLVNVGAVHCMVTVCCNLCGSRSFNSLAGEGRLLSTGVVQYVSSAIYGFWPEASDFHRRFFTVWIDHSMKAIEDIVVNLSRG